MLCLSSVFTRILADNCPYIFQQLTFVQTALIVIGFSRFHIRVELLALYVFSSAFGGWIGIIFAENEELPTMELVIYYVEHFFTSFGGPLVLCISGRFDPTDYMGLHLPVCGFHIFCAYMRWVLTPLSQLTWANLNHTLCGVGNDPFYEHLDLGYTYYFWADFYLLFSCYVGLVLNFVICYLFKAIFGRFFLP